MLNDSSTSYPLSPYFRGERVRVRGRGKARSLRLPLTPTLSAWREGRQGERESEVMRFSPLRMWEVRWPVRSMRGQCSGQPSHAVFGFPVAWKLGSALSRST